MYISLPRFVVGSQLLICSSHKCLWQTFIISFLWKHFFKLVLSRIIVYATADVILVLMKYCPCSGCHRLGNLKHLNVLLEGSTRRHILIEEMVMMPLKV